MITPRLSTHFSRTLLATALAAASFGLMQPAQAANTLAPAAPNVCFASYTGNATDFSSADASAVRDAVAAASAGGVVKIAGTCVGVVNGSVVSVTKGVTLRGGYTSADWSTSNPTANPTVLDAQGAGRVISASATAPIAIENLTVQNALWMEKNGGGLYVKAASVSISGTKFLSNTAYRGGGAYVDYNSSYAPAPVMLWMTNTTFISNTAVSPTGLGIISAQGGEGGGLYAARGVNFEVSGSRFQSNTVDGGQMLGGGMYGSGPFSRTVRIADTVFTGNVGNYGGGLCVDAIPDVNMEVPLELVNVQFISNGSDQVGVGGGASIQVPVFVTNTDFIRNNAHANAGGGGLSIAVISSKTSSISGGVFQQNFGTAGGGLSVENGSVSIAGTKFLSNTANVGGAISFISVSQNPTTLSLNSVALISNTAADDGSTYYGYAGGLYAGAYVDVQITDSRFERNVVPNGYGQGGAMELDYSTARIVNTVFARNGASITGDDVYLYQAGQVDALQNTFAARTGAGSSVAADGTTASTILTNSLFSGYGKGVELLNSAAAVTLNGVLWDSVSTPTSGGATVNNATTGSAGFADAAAGNYLATGSGVDAGVNSGVATDIRGVTRPQGVGYDLGAYESSNSTDAELSGLSINPGTLSPAFVSSTTSYAAQVPYGTTSIATTATPNTAGAAVTYASTAGACTGSNCPIASSGTTTITITITAGNGATTKTYTIAVTVAAEATVPHISDLVVDIPGLTPAFVSTTLNYQTEVPSGTNQLVVTPTLSAGAMAEYSSTAGACTDNGTSGTCPLLPTETTTVTIGLTDGATTRNYTIVATRASAPGAVRKYWLSLIPKMK